MSHGCARVARCLRDVFAVLDYDALRKETAVAIGEKIDVVRGLVVKVQKTQRAAEEALDKYAFLWGRYVVLHDGRWHFT